MQKKFLPIIAVVVILLVGGGALAYTKFTGSKPVAASPAPAKKKITAPVNVIPVAERPYLQIAPVADGRNVMIIAKTVNKPADTLEYELEYQTESLLQGQFGSLKLATLPSQITILLGSCSAGGACTYHKDVKGGTLLTRYDGPEDYALKSDWRYFDNKTKETEFSSRDAKFQLKSEALKTQKYVIVFNAPGYPEGLTGTPVSDPFSLAVSSDLVAGSKGTLTIRANEEGSLKIMGWDGKTWKDFGGTVDGKSITAEVDLMELYVVVR